MVPSSVVHLELSANIGPGLSDIGYSDVLEALPNVTEMELSDLDYHCLEEDFFSAPRVRSLNKLILYQRTTATAADRRRPSVLSVELLHDLLLLSAAPHSDGRPAILDRVGRRIAERL